MVWNRSGFGFNVNDLITKNQEGDKNRHLNFLEFKRSYFLVRVEFYKFRFIAATTFFFLAGGGSIFRLMHGAIGRHSGMSLPGFIFFSAFMT